MQFWKAKMQLYNAQSKTHSLALKDVTGFVVGVTNKYSIHLNYNLFQKVATILSVLFCPHHFVQYHFVSISFFPYYFLCSLLSTTILSGHQRF